MSEQVKRFALLHGSLEYADALCPEHLPRWVQAVDYDALAQRCLELSINHGLLRDELLSEQQSIKSWREEVHAWKGRVADMTHMNGALMTERNTLRAEVERLRNLFAECAEYLNHNELTSIGHGSILHRKMMEAGACAPTTGATPEA